MAAINPNLNFGILVDEFIRMATQHLLTVQGSINTTATYLPANSPAPSIVLWKGYRLKQTIREQELGGIGNIPELVNTNYKAGQPKKTIALFVEDEVDLQNEEGVVYPELFRADGSKIINYGNTKATNFKAKNDEARQIAEAYLGKPFESDEEWSNFISLINAESTSNQEEQALVAAVILNRTRLGWLGAKNVNTTISLPNQFEPVTGPATSRVNYLRGPSPLQEQRVFGSIKQFLPTADKELVNFTSNEICLYVFCDSGFRGTPLLNADGSYRKREKRRVEYLLELRAKPSARIVGGTIFSRK